MKDEKSLEACIKDKLKRIHKLSEELEVKSFNFVEMDPKYQGGELFMMREKASVLAEAVGELNAYWNCLHTY